MQPVITLENVTLRYGRNTALHDVSGSFTPGSLTAIAGPNGSGKSTLLKLIAGILKPSKGRVVLQHMNGMAYLPQGSAVQRDFPMPVAQAVATGFWPSAGLNAPITDDHHKRVRDALDEVGLTGLEHRQIGTLSGGQFQRMLFARIIVQNARVILLDEPFTAVDAETTARLMQLLLKWHKEGRTIICVLHDLLLIQKYFPDSFVLAGKCLGKGHTHEMFQQKLLSFDLDMAELCAGDEQSHAVHEHTHDEHCGHNHPEHRH
jgi:zinc/manganese transport system ATP-binding protein